MGTPNGTLTVAIVGGGAVGAALFGALVDALSSEASSRARPRIVLFEKSERVGPGLAYAKDESPYLLNQSAQTMSLVPGRRAHFCEWLVARGLAREGDGELFCARQVFGDYVEDCFGGAHDKARRRGLVVSTVRDEVSALVPRRLGGYRVVTRAHAPIDADVVVLAVGNLPSTKLRGLGGSGFVPSPYPSAAMCARIPPNARVAILGTGLSAIDAALALVAAGHEAPITMASRSGLLPAVRGPLHPYELKHVTRANIACATEDGRHPLRWSTVVRWLALEIERHDLSLSWDRLFPAWLDPLDHYTSQIAAAERGARVWQSIGEALNPMIEVIWHHIADDDKRLFLDRFYSRFMSHWVPIPLTTARRVKALLAERKLAVLPDVAGVTFDAESRAYHLRFRDEPERPIAFDFVIDATGAPRHLHDCDSPLLRALLTQGTIAAHDSGGLRVDFTSLRVLAKDGRTDPSLFALGNLTSGTHLFTSTLELNVEKADRIAPLIVSELHRCSEKEPHVDATPHST